MATMSFESFTSMSYTVWSLNMMLFWKLKSLLLVFANNMAILYSNKVAPKQNQISATHWTYKAGFSEEIFNKLVATWQHPAF